MQPTESEATEDRVELAVPLETVCYIIEKAHDLQGKTESSGYDDDRDEVDDPDTEVLEDRPTDPVSLELHAVISDLPEDAQIDLVALMWLGRDEDDWGELRTLAEQEHNDATADYLCGTPLLSDFLEAGLDILGYDCRAWEAERS
jgi:hypothetical protein